MKIFSVFILLALSGCADFGRVQGVDSQNVADMCARDAYANGKAAAMDWVPLVGMGLANDMRRETFKVCVERMGHKWVP